MHHRHLWIAALFLFGFATSTAQAGIDIYKLEKPHTQVMFAINHMGLSVSHGKFTKYEGEIVFNTDQPEKSSVQATIDTTSLDLNDQTWNEHVMDAKLLDAVKFPTMTFKSTAIKVTGDNTADITGDLTLHGVTRPVTLAVTYRKGMKDPYSPHYKVGFSAMTQIKRSDFGVTMGIPLVSDEVDIALEVEGIRDDHTDQQQ